MQDVKTLQIVASKFGCARNVVLAFTEETGHEVSISTVARALRGEAKPAVIAFLIYGLSNAVEKKKSLLVTKSIKNCLSGDSCEDYMRRMRQIKNQDPGAYNRIEMYGTP